MDTEVSEKKASSCSVMMCRLTPLSIGSTIAYYTGQTLYKKVLESSFFAKKEYAKAMTDAFLALDKSLIEGNERDAMQK